MAELLKWDQVGKRTYEMGVRKGVLYKQANDGSYPVGEAWNGLSSVTQSPSGAEPSKIYADDINYLNVYSAEEFGGTIEAYTYPAGFAECNGEASMVKGVNLGQQARKSFGFCYRSVVGNDVESEAYGYKLNLIYGAKVSPSEKQHSTINDSPEPSPFSWEFAATPVPVKGYNPTCVLTFDSTQTDSAIMTAIEAVLYGTDAVYTKTQDQSPSGSKTYYTKSGDSYVEFTGDSFVSGTDYYEKTAEAVPARLPLPDEIADIIADLS